MSTDQPNDIEANDIMSLLLKQESQKYAELQDNDNDNVNDNDHNNNQDSKNQPPSQSPKPPSQATQEEKQNALIEASINERPNDDPLVIQAQSDNTPMELLKKAKLPDPQKFSTSAINKEIFKQNSSDNVMKLTGNTNKNYKNPTSSQSILNFQEVKFNKNAKSKRNIHQQQQQPQQQQQLQQQNRSQVQAFASRKVISKVDRKMALDSSASSSSQNHHHHPNNQFKSNNSNKKKDNILHMNRDEIKNSSSNNNNNTVQKEKLFQFPMGALPPANSNESASGLSLKQRASNKAIGGQIHRKQGADLEVVDKKKKKLQQQQQQQQQQSQLEEGSDNEEVKENQERHQKSNHKQQQQQQVNKGKVNQNSRVCQELKFQQTDQTSKHIPVSYLSSSSFNKQTQATPRKNNQVQQLLKSILAAQEKQTTRLNQIERQITRNPMIEKLEKKIQQKIQDHVEGSVRKSLQKLPEALSHKIHHQLVKNISEMVKKSFTGCIENLLLPTFQNLFKTTSLKLTEPINKLLIAIKERIKDDEIRSQSLQKYFMQTIDALESAVEEVEQHLEGQKEYFENVKSKISKSTQQNEDAQGDDQKSSQYALGSTLQQKKEESKKKQPLSRPLPSKHNQLHAESTIEPSHSNRDIISETKSVQGVNQGYSPFTPRLNQSLDDPQFPKNEQKSFQYLQKSEMMQHSRSVCEKDNLFNSIDGNQKKILLSSAMQKISHQLKSKNYQEALQIALMEKKQDLMIYVLDNTPDKLVYLSHEILGESFRFMSQNWKPNASVDLAKKLPYLKQLQIFKDSR